CGEANRGTGPRRIPFSPWIPATVVTAPLGVILRIVALPVSATYTFPAVSTVTPDGCRKPAAPVPSVLSGIRAVPASVVTSPTGVSGGVVRWWVAAADTWRARSPATPVG